MNESDEPQPLYGPSATPDTKPAEQHAGPWDEFAEVRMPNGMRLISKRRAVDVLLDAVHPLPAATMDGPVRKSYLAHFMPEKLAPSDELTFEDEVKLELIWRAAGLPWPNHPTEAEWKGKYMKALQGAPDAPDWLPVSTWGANCRIAEQSREEGRRRYLADVFQGLPEYDSFGMLAPPEFADYWNTLDVAAAVERVGQAATVVEQTPAEQWQQASPERKRELAAEAVKLHRTQEKAAASLGISRQNLAKYLRNGLRNPDATVASPFHKSAWEPHKR
jgi:hypothetical protein